jgi:hypothetical protein
LRTPANRISKTLWSLLLLALFPVTGLAHTLEAPDTVLAAEDGSFSYEVVYTIGPGSVLFGGSGWTGVQNVPGQMHGDCGCIPGCELEEGYVGGFFVTATLGNPGLQGSVDNWVAFCGDPDLGSTTIIMPAGPVPILPSTWGAIKALYAIESLHKWR